MSENRKRPCLLRVTPEVDALVRAYAAKEGCTPNEAAEVFHGLSESERERLTAECWEDAQLAGDEYETLDDHEPSSWYEEQN